MKSMSELDVERRKAIESYCMPYVYLSQWVLFCAGRGAEWEAAIVTRVTPKYVDLAVLPPNQHNFAVKSGVKHRTDPSLAVSENAPYWDYNEIDRPLFEQHQAKAGAAQKKRQEEEAKKHDSKKTAQILEGKTA